MILLYRFVELLIKIFIIYLIVSFEKVIGLPVLFLTVVVSFMLITRSFSKYIVFILAAFMLSIFYQIAFVVSFVLIAFFYFGFVLGYQVVESNLKRFLALLVISCVFIAFISSINISFWIVMQILIGMGVSSIFLLKFLFVKYGFIGTKLSTKQSFFK